jgi:ketosteroid isomerase-like protein
MKRPVFLLGISLVVIAGITTHAVKAAMADQSAKEEIIKISDEREHALETGDVAALDRIDADDLVYTNWRGVSMTKAEHLANIKAKELSFQTMQHSDVRVVVHGNTGIVTGVSATNVNYKGSSPGGTRKFVNVFAKENGHWICVVHFEALVQK